MFESEVVASRDLMGKERIHAGQTAAGAKLMDGQGVVSLATKLRPSSSGDRSTKQCLVLCQQLAETNTTTMKSDSLSAGLGPRCLH
jgi:hypothetical protein